MSIRVFAPVPANGAALNVSQVHSARRHPLIESSCSARHKGEARAKTSLLAFLSPEPSFFDLSSYLSPAARRVGACLSSEQLSLRELCTRPRHSPDHISDVVCYQQRFSVGTNRHAHRSSV